MKRRCADPNHHAYAAYGGRGIRVCEQWLRSFSTFLRDVGKRPSPEHSLERRDNEHGYGPDNCYWATPREQANNRRNTRYVEVDGEQVPLGILAARHGLNTETLGSRLRRGWTLQKALEVPLMARPVKAPAALLGLTIAGGFLASPQSEPTRRMLHPTLA